METLDAIKTKVEVRQYSDKPVPANVKSEILEAARLTGSSSNSQHWRFVLVQEKQNLTVLAADSITGKWASGANFAIIVLTNPKIPAHSLDAGRAIQDMQLAAWSLGVGSGIFTGINHDKLRKDFQIPQELQTAAVVAFGYPAQKVSGKKKMRNP